MKKKVVQYAIAEPCHESWSAMTPTQQGRFCDSCAKPVIDFTSMTDTQVLKYMSQTTGPVCGRMTSFQLHRDFTQYEMNQTRSFSLRALVLGTAITTFSALNARAQGEVQPIKGEIAPEPVEYHMLGQMIVRDTVVKTDTLFSGTVIDYLAHDFVAMTSVSVYDAEGNELASTLTNGKGQFRLPLVAGQHPYSAVFRKEEYEEKSYLFEDLLTTTGVTVEMTREMHIIMGLVAPQTPPSDK